MSTFSTYLEAAVLNHVFRNVAMTSPASVYLALFAAAPTDAGGGTEVSGSGYAREVVTFGAAAADPDDSSRQAVINSAEINFSTAHDPAVSVVAVGYYDAATSGNLLAWASIPAASLGVGADIKFPSGSLKMVLS